MRALVKYAAMSLAVVVGLGTVANAAPVVVARFQNGLAAPFGAGTYSGTEDTYLSGAASTGFNINYGGSTGIITDNARGNLALMRFDLTSMQGQFDHVTSASLFLRASAGLNGWVSGDPIPNMSAFSVLPANGDWVGGSGTSLTATDGSSTWNSKQSFGAAGPASPELYQPGPNNVPWKDSNGNSVTGLGLDKTKPTDSSTWGFGPTALATTPLATAQNQIIRLDLPASLIEQWISGTNYGLVLTSVDTPSSYVPQYYTGNKNNAAAPELVLNYVVPEPMTGSLLLLSGGLLALRRRGTNAQAT